jgi:cellulose biosynthesis protein BcsQ
MEKKGRGIADVDIIAVVSGKGGVGKTMLSVAIANELSLSSNTILLDLDFFNRGLTGLFASLKSSSPRRSIKPPTFLDNGEVPDWSLAEVNANLFMVYFDDLDKSQIDLVEQRDTGRLANEMLIYVNYLAQEISAKFVVLDCHGGPDSTSYSACAIASRAMLVSEPDQITLHGTLHFLRNLKAQVPSASLDIRLIFSKVVAAFSSTFLFRLYNEYLRREFGGKDLVAIIPLEIDLTKAFEKSPFLTTIYPYSQLAIKTRLALFEMFGHKADVVLPPQIKAMTATERFVAKYYMGRWPRVLDLDYVLKAIAVYSLVTLGGPFLIDMILVKVRGTGMFLPLVVPLWPLWNLAFLLCAYWVLVVMFLNWTRKLDVSFTYYIRTRSIMLAAAAWVTLLGLWSVPSILFGLIIGETLRGTGSQLGGGIPQLVKIVLMVPAGLMVFNTRRGVRNIRFERRYVEGGCRILLSVIVVGIIILLAFIQRFVT